MDLSDARTAVVIAAGAGSRLRRTASNGDLPKPLTPALGLPIIVRTLATLAEQGIRRGVIVTGYGAPAVEALLRSAASLRSMELSFVHNREWRRQNGLSVLAAAKAVGEAPYLLTMADHLYSGLLVEALRAARLAGAATALAVDRRAQDVRDIDDAVRVRTRAGGRILDIGKGLEPFDAIDTGVFLCAPALFGALEAERRARGGDCSLSDGVRRLASEGSAVAVEIPEAAWWQDVDTLADLRLAEGKIAGSVALAVG